MSSTASIATGVTANHGDCLNPTGFFIEELTTANNLCATDHRWQTTGAEDYSEHIYNTAFGSATLVTGVDLRVTVRDAPGATATLFYVTAAGARTNIGSGVTETTGAGSFSVLFDLSGQSGTVPSGAKLGVRLAVTGIGRIYIGSEDSRTVGFSSGILNVMQ